MASTYEVRCNRADLIRPSKGHATLADAREAIESQRDGLVYEVWDDGTVAYYLDQEDADRDDTGEGAIAIATTSEDA